jgi:hypothetical protein
MSITSKLVATCLMAVTCGITSCRHTVSYKPKQDDRTITVHFPGNLRVMKFYDASPKAKSINLNVGQQKWKTNALDIYKDKEYAGAISRMIAADLARTGLFDHVMTENSREHFTDYVLMGTIWDYSGMGRWKTIPENAVIFGSMLGSIPGALLSAAATSQVKTEVTTDVILTDVRIVDLRTAETVWTCPPLRAGGEETVRWSKADPQQLAKRLDERLRETVTQLIEHLQQASPSALRK